jgi:hypothetical protein
MGLSLEALWLPARPSPLGASVSPAGFDEACDEAWRLKEAKEQG